MLWILTVCMNWEYVFYCGTLNTQPAEFRKLISVEQCFLICSVSQWYPTFCDLIVCGPPGSSVLGIFQERILERVAISSCRGYS